MKDIIIFDTNAIKNQGLNNFLGGREVLRQLEPDADFLIPELVVEEIKTQKKREFVKTKKQLFSNQLITAFSIDLSSIEAIDIESHIEQLKETEEFNFEIIPCVQGELVDQFRHMAIGNQAPFNKDSDKGFKDACIYVSILNFIPELSDRSIFFWGSDGRLKDAFEGHDSISVINSLELYHQKSSRFLMDDYFYGLLSDELNSPIDESNISGTWKNKDDNWVVKISIAESVFLVEVDSREIVSKIQEAELESKISDLVYSGGFSTTHSAVSELQPLIPFLSSEDIQRINTAVEDNNQIRWIADDDDVEEFLEELNK